MRPRIGVTSWHHQDAEEQWEYVRDNYTRAVNEAGGLPLILPIASYDLNLIPEYLETVDGLLFTGGEDVHPSFYGEIVLERCGVIDEKRDLFEIELCRQALDRDLPVLGICRGCQLINVALGGSLCQDLSYRPGTSPLHNAPKERRGEPIHGVTILPETRLMQILGVGEAKVTSSHHQILREIAPSLKANALGEDGIIEGVEGEGFRFLLAVQWHPERLALRDPLHLRLFRALIDSTTRSR